MDAVWLVSRRKRWTSNAFKTECRKWFSLLLKVVDIKKGVENTFGSFLESGKDVTLDKDYRPHIETEVRIIYVHIFQWTEFARGIIESLLPPPPPSPLDESGSKTSEMFASMYKIWWEVFVPFGTFLAHKLVHCNNIVK